MIKTDKNYNTGLRILEILKVLLDSGVTKHELIESIKQNNEIENVKTQEAFIKYFNTFKLLGLDIIKDKKTYKLNNAFYKITISNEDVGIIHKLIENAYKLYSIEDETTFYKIFLKLEKYLNVDFQQKIKDVIEQNAKRNNDNLKHNLILTLEKLIQEEQLVSLTYKKNAVVECSLIVLPKEIKEKNKKIYLIYYDSEIMANKKVLIDSIKNIKPFYTQAVNNITNPVIFKVFGKLANSYRLKESEKVIDGNSSVLTISNENEDRDSLMLRLLKYGESCKIEAPEDFKNEFIMLTGDILNNLENG